MAIPQTDFINGFYLSFPIGNYVKLFSVLGQRTKRGFFEEIKKIDGKDGEGMTPEQIIGLFHVGLIPCKPDITPEEAGELVQEYIFENGNDGLYIKLVDAFCDSGLSDRKAIEKQRKMIEELNKIEDARNEALIKQSWIELDKLNAAIQKISEELTAECNTTDVSSDDSCCESNLDTDTKGPLEGTETDC